MASGVEALKQMFWARSVAVVGASNNTSKWGYALLDTIRRSGYDGDIYPINLKEKAVQGIKAYPSVCNVPGPVELVLIIVPAPYVLGVVQEAAAKGVRAAAILSAGFRESGRADLEAEVRQVAQDGGVRLLGPNIQGFAYLPNRLCAMFWPAMTTPGPLAVIAQSGSVTSALAEWAADDGVGISAAVNLGNQADLCESDVLEFFAQDPSTRAIALYLESVKDGRRFLEVARRVASVKPVVVLKSGCTEEGRESATSHTGSLAGDDQVFGAVCRQTGLVRVDDLEALYDLAKALALMPEPSGRRVLIVSTSGGGATLAADAAGVEGLALPRLPAALVEDLRQLNLPGNASLSNPLDLPSLDASLFEQAVTLADKHGVADQILVSFGDPVPGSTEMLPRLKKTIRAGLSLAYFGGGEVERASVVPLHEAGIPVYRTPERGVRAMAATVWRAQRYAINSGESRDGRGCQDVADR